MHLNIPIISVWSGREKHISSNLPFDPISTTFLPGKILSEKGASKLRSIAELRAFDGTHLCI
jgi:hypothetical protein